MGEDLRGRVLGEFELVERIGDGGHGVVYLARQERLDRDVVVKVLHGQLQNNPDAEMRFMREAKLASRLDHPNAAHVYEAGWEKIDDLLWIAMEYVEGVTLRDSLDERGPMPLERFVPFFEQLAAVLDAAHAKGIIHRDIKPSNVMVRDADGRPKLLDFGIAKDLGSADRLHVTPVARRRLGPGRDGSSSSKWTDGTLGSFQYMPFEQWIDAGAVRPTADLYALAVLAYEALTGRLPFAVENEDQSAELAELHRSAPVPPVGPGLPVELDRIFQRALAKRPEDRFASAAEFASALRVALLSRMTSRVRDAAEEWQRGRRRPELLWRGSVLAELEEWISEPSGNLTPLDHEFIDASRAAAQAEAEAARLEAKARRLRSARVRVAAAAAVVFVAGSVLTVTGLLQRLSNEEAQAEQDKSEAKVTAAELEQGRAALLHSESGEALRHLGEAWRRGERSPSTEFMLARAVQPRLAEEARFAASSGRMWWAAFSPDGKRIVTTDDKSAQVWDAQTKQRLFLLPHGDIVYQAAYSADGARIVTACGDSAVRIWDAASGALVRELRQAVKQWRYTRVAISHDGHIVAAIDRTGAVAHVWNADTGALLAALRNDSTELASLAFSADDRWLATCGGDDVRVFDTRAWTRALTLAGPGMRSLSWDPTGPRIATGTESGDASIWAIPGGTRVHHLREVGEPITALTFSSNGGLVATASRDGAQQIWNATSGKLQSRIDLRRGKVLSVEFDLTGKRVLAANADGAVVVSDAVQGIPSAVLEGPDQLVLVAHFDPGSHRVVAASWDGTARLWDATAPYRRGSLPPSAAGPVAAGPTRTSPDGHRLVTLPTDEGSPVLLCDEHNQLIAKLEGHVGRVWFARFVRDAQEVLTGGADGTVRRWSAATGQLIQTYRGPVARFPMDAEFSPGGQLLVAGGGGGMMQFWDAESARLLWAIQAHGSNVVSVHFDGEDIVTRGLTGDVGRWTLPDPEQVIRACAARRCGIVTP